MKKNRPEALLRRYDAWEPATDKIEFQWKARLLQAMWREGLGLPSTPFAGKLRGAQMPMPDAKESLVNYLTPAIRDLVRREVDDPVRARGKLFGKPRIYNNLLSSQPLCFNLFGELALDLELATKVFAELSAGDICRVDGVEFEFSPGRGDPRYTGDRSAYDVYVRYHNAKGAKCFLGIEVKYHEGLDDAEADHRPRYDELISEMGCFKAECLDEIKRKPLQQIMRDHILVGAHQLVDGFEEGVFVFLHPEGNTRCLGAVESYRACLSSTASFESWTIEAVVTAIQSHCDAAWVDEFYRRYLDFSGLTEGETLG